MQEFEGLKTQFLTDIKAVLTLKDIPDQLILNWNHTRHSKSINFKLGSHRCMIKTVKLNLWSNFLLQYFFPLVVVWMYNGDLDIICQYLKPAVSIYKAILPNI